LGSAMWWSLVSQGGWNFSSCNISNRNRDKICSSAHIREWRAFHEQHNWV
jgi:hypothetical protein